MNNAMQSGWLYVLAALPLSLLATSFETGAIIALVFLAISLSVLALQQFTQSLSRPLGYILLLITAAAVGAIADLILCAFVPTYIQSVHAFAPLFAFVAIGFAMLPGHGLGAKKTITLIFLSALLVVAAGGLRELFGAGLLLKLFAKDQRGLLLLLMPHSVLIGIGLILAATNRWRNPTKPSDTKVRRVRVTGPVS